MEPLTQDTKNLLQAIQGLYSLRSLSSFGVEVLAIVAQLVPSEVPVFHLTNFQSRQISYTFLPSCPGFTPEMEEVPRRHWREHPLTWNIPRTLGGAYKTSDFTTQAELHRLEGFYQQFMRVMGCEDQMTIFLLNNQPQSWNEHLQGSDSVAGVSLNRSQRNFTERERLILNLLRPHLLQAYCNAQHYHQLQQNLTQLHQALDDLGLIILNTSGQIQLITSQAIQYLQIYFAKPTHSLQLPDHLWAWFRHQISCSTKDSDLTNTRLPLRIEKAGKQLVVRLVFEPDEERYLLLLEEQTLSLLTSLKLLELSTRETEVLFWVIQGKDNQAIAKHLSVHISTVRKHLESVYRKLGVQSRTEAIAQALEKSGILNSPSIV